MKKILLFLIGGFLAIFATSERGSIQTKTSDSMNVPSSSTLRRLSIQADTYALDGTTKADASGMVKNFDGSYYDPKGRYCFWYPSPTLAAFCKSVGTLHRGDGIRFYFANSKTGNNYILIPVATVDGGSDGCATSQRIHNDYFFTTLPVAVSAGRTDENDPAGATLFGPTPCPSGTDNCLNSTHYIPCGKASDFVNMAPHEKINAKSEWFSTKLISYLIGKAGNNGGIRFYFGKHLSYNSCDNTPRHGVIMMVTDGSAIQKDVPICIPNDFKNRHPWISGGGADNGEQCQPNCQGATLPQN